LSANSLRLSTFNHCIKKKCSGKGGVGRQRAEGRRERREEGGGVRRQRAGFDVSAQPNIGRRQRAEGRGQKAEGRGRNSKLKTQNSKLKTSLPSPSLLTNL
jgi:hypothetical protein